MVLFVFTIMLLNAGVEERTRGSRIALLVGGPGVVVLVGMISWTIFTNDKQLGMVQIGSMVAKADNTHSIATLLFKDFLLPFEITSVLILIAIMGAVVLAGRRR
jgi:NADH-quinone oxidoreductase subunit J